MTAGRHMSSRSYDRQLIKKLSVHVYSELALCPHVVDVLRTIHIEHPGLLFEDFFIAVAMAEHYEREVKGRA